MKKKYEKPGLYIESFALSQAIALNCNLGHKRDEGTLGEPNYGDSMSCGWKGPDGKNYWTSDLVNKCTDEQYGPNDDVGFGCYNNPSATNALFAYS